MYATFKKETGQTRTQFRAGEQIRLFGCNEGWIPWLVQEMMPPRQYPLKQVLCRTTLGGDAKQIIGAMTS